MLFQDLHTYRFLTIESITFTILKATIQYKQSIPVPQIDRFEFFNQTVVGVNHGKGCGRHSKSEWMVREFCERQGV